jgi:hypothetical protein
LHGNRPDDRLQAGTPTPEQRAEIDATLDAFAAACNRIAEVARSIHFD